MQKFNLGRFIPYLIVLICGLIIFWPTFSLHLNADNWMVLWGGETTLGTISKWHFWTTYFSPYGSSYVILHVMSKIFGYNATPLYILNFAFRFLAVSELMYFLQNLKIKKSIVMLTGIIFMVSPIGLEVTDWVFQMTSYISVFFLLIAARYIFTLDSPRRVAYAFLAVMASIIVNPIRGHGLFLTIWLTIVVSFMADKAKRKYLASLFVLSIILFIFLLKALTFGDPVSTSGMIAPGIASIKNSVVIRDYTIPAHYFRNTGFAIIPDKFIEQFKLLRLTENLFGNYKPGIEVIIVAVCMLSILFYSKRYLFRNKVASGLLAIYAPLLVAFLYTANKKLLLTNLSDNSRLSVAVGFTVIATLGIFIVLDLFWGKKENAKLTAFLFGITSFFTLLPWIADPIGFINTTGRYLVFAILLIPIFISDLTNSLEGFKKWLAYSLALMIIFSFSYITTFEIDQMYSRHGKVYGEKLWSQIDSQLAGEEFNDARSVFYFKSDNPARLHDLIVSSFPFRMGLYYKIWDFDKLPHGIESFADFTSMITDGEASLRYIGKVHKFELKDVYAFEIKNDIVTRIDLDTINEKD